VLSRDLLFEGPGGKKKKTALVQDTFSTHVEKDVVLCLAPPGEKKGKSKGKRSLRASPDPRWEDLSFLPFREEEGSSVAGHKEGQAKVHAFTGGISFSLAEES